MESTKPKTKHVTVVLKERLDKLEETLNKPVDVEPLNSLIEKIDTLEKTVATLNIDGLKSRLFDIEDNTRKSIGEFRNTLNTFSEAFEKFKKIWGHNEEGISINDHFQSENPEEDFIRGGPPVDKQGNELPKSKLVEEMIGEQKTFIVP